MQKKTHKTRWKEEVPDEPDPLKPEVAGTWGSGVGTGPGVVMRNGWVCSGIQTLTMPAVMIIIIIIIIIIVKT